MKPWPNYPGAEDPRSPATPLPDGGAGEESENFRLADAQNNIVGLMDEILTLKEALRAIANPHHNQKRGNLIAIAQAALDRTYQESEPHV